VNIIWSGGLDGPDRSRDCFRNPMAIAWASISTPPASRQQPSLGQTLANAQTAQMTRRVQGEMNSNRSLLIIGGGGFIGGHLSEAAKASWNVHVADRSSPAFFNNSCRVDVTSANDVHNACEKVRPSVVVNLAAISDIDRCERERDKARSVNIRGAENVARETAAVGARLVFLSSAAVFDGRQHGYREADQPNPLSFYGQTKLEAEKAIREMLPSAIILRPALVLGYSGAQGTNSLLNKWIDSWNSEKPVNVPTEEYRNPIDAPTLVKIILFLVEHRASNGTYHVGALDSASRYQIAQKVAECLGHSQSLVIPSNESLPGRAIRGRDHFLLTDRIRAVCPVALGTTEEVIRRSANAAAESRL
jgi:dTDP-4-dehydrorhamnose reductase